MPPVYRNDREICGMLGCNRRLVIGKSFKVGTAHFLPYFKNFVGTSWPSYSEETRICDRCSVRVKNTQRHVSLPTPGKRPYHLNDNSMEVTTSEFSSLESTATPLATSIASSQPTISEYEASGSFDMSDGSRIAISSSSLSEDTDSPMNTQTSSSSIESQNPSFPDIRACISTQSKCFICNVNARKTLLARKRIPTNALQQVWHKMGIFIPLKNRCCDKHLDENGFTDEALNLIREGTTTIKLSSVSLYEWVKAITTPQQAPRDIFDFSEDGVTEADYQRLLGVSKSNFEDLLHHIEGTLRNTGTRTVSNALAMFLMFLRTGCSQDHLAYCFQVDQKIVSNAINSVTEALDQYFVPQNLGVDHVSQEDYLRCHTRETFIKALSISEDSTLIIADGTYVFIEKPSDIEEQKLTYSGQKKRNFLRYMVIVLPSGHILDCFGPFPATKSDADVLPDLLTDDLLEFVGPSPSILVDRGFVRCKPALESKGFTVFDPSWIDPQSTQLTTQDGNQSRLVTMCRWVIEATFGRLKQKFRLFMHAINGRYSMGKITKFFRIACGILNKYFSIGFHETPRNVSFATAAVQRGLTTENEFQQMLQEDSVIRLTRRWKKVDANTVSDFPRLTLVDLESLTLGPYQLRVAKKYVREHMKVGGYFELRASNDHANDGYVRAQIHSRFGGQKIHSVFVKYDSAQIGTSSVLGYYCSCKAGARLVGCCAHIATVLRYLSHDRYVQSTSVRRVAGNEFYAAAIHPLELLESSVCSD